MTVLILHQESKDRNYQESTGIGATVKMSNTLERKENDKEDKERRAS